MYVPAKESECHWSNIYPEKHCSTISNQKTKLSAAGTTCGGAIAYGVLRGGMFYAAVTEIGVPVKIDFGNVSIRCQPFSRPAQNNCRPQTAEADEGISEGIFKGAIWP